MGTKLVVQLVAVAVPFDDFVAAVDGLGLGARHQAAGVAAQPHGAALVLHPSLLGQQADDRVGALRVELGGVGLVAAEEVTGELHHHHLKAQAKPQVGDAVLAGVAGGLDLALKAPLPEATGDDDAVRLRQRPSAIRRLHVLRVQPADVDPRLVVDASVGQGLPDREVGVRQLYVLPHQDDLQMRARVLQPLYPLLPVLQVAGGGG